MNSIGLGSKNTAMNSLMFGAKNTVSAPNFFVNVFGSYTTLALTLVLFISVFVTIYLYFKNIGYTIDMGWDKLMNTFLNKEKVEVSLTDGNKEAGSLSLEPPQSQESKKLKELLGIDASGGNKPDLGFPPPSVNGRLPFNPEERPSGMPGAREPTEEYEEKKNKKRWRGIFKSKDTDAEVFNVSRNLYTYEEAAPLCKAMGAELATYEQVSNAQKNGADWCNYGWTKGQMAVFPTSKKTWAKLQSGPPAHRNSCGKPGVNGGFFDNPELRFGVNCFGSKPNKKDTDELLNDTDFSVPPTAEQIEFDKKVEKFREQIGNVSILPWNRKKWTE